MESDRDLRRDRPVSVADSAEIGRFNVPEDTSPPAFDRRRSILTVRDDDGALCLLVVRSGLSDAGDPAVEGLEGQRAGFQCDLLAGLDAGDFSSVSEISASRDERFSITQIKSPSRM